MCDILSLIKNCIDLIESETNADVIIYDFYGAFHKTDIKKMPQLDRWHLNHYCLRVKENPQIYRKCKQLKHRFYDKVFSSNTVVKSTCFCGVCEYAVPIVTSSLQVGIISVTGFKGEISHYRKSKLIERLGVSLEEFDSVIRSYLVLDSRENYVRTMLQILAFLFKEYIKKENLVTLKNPENNPYVIKALEYIDRNFTKDITISHVARECHISVSYLQYLFAKGLGYGVAESIRKKRIDYAKELLSTTDFSVKYISFESGFLSADYFSVIFKKECGVTPLKYRKITSSL